MIVLRGLTYGSATASGDVVTVWSQTGGMGSALGSLTFLTKSGAPSSTEAAAAAVQINSLAPLPCFAAGTRIATADGWVKVENLRVGDLVATPDGRSQPIVWIGSRSVDCARHPRPETVWPVRVSAGAFEAEKPNRDLFLSPDHAVLVSGVLIPIKHLINDRTIRQVSRNAITYYHVELPRHDVMLAEGLPAESWLDTDDRSGFDNVIGPIRLFPDFATIPCRTAMAREAHGCAPLVLTGLALTAVRRRLAARAQRLNGPASEPPGEFRQRA
jgi:hypothetical protein